MKKTDIEKKEKPLSMKEEIFLNEWLIDKNCYKAAIAAGYSKNVANTRASQWVSDGSQNDKPHLTLAIKRKVQEIVKKSEINRDKIENELAKLAFAPFPSKTVKNRDKIAALELLGKGRGMFKESVEISGNPLTAMGIAVYIPDNGRNDDSGK